MTISASSTAVAAARPTAVHRACDHDADDAEVAPAVCPCRSGGIFAVGAGVFGSLLSGGTSVPTGETLGSALNPQSSSAAPSRYTSSCTGADGFITVTSSVWPPRWATPVKVAPALVVLPFFTPAIPG